MGIVTTATTDRVARAADVAAGAAAAAGIDVVELVDVPDLHRVVELFATVWSTPAGCAREPPGSSRAGSPPTVPASRPLSR